MKKTQKKKKKKQTTKKKKQSKQTKSCTAILPGLARVFTCLKDHPSSEVDLCLALCFVL